MVMSFDAEKIDGLIVQCRLSEAIAGLALTRSDHRIRAGICAIAGDDRGIAAAVDPALFACRTAAGVAEFYAANDVEPTVYDHLAAAAVLAWSSDSKGVYASLAVAHDRAVCERSFHLAVAARERLARHALLFGDVETARTAVAEANDRAESHDLARWQVRCVAVAAQLALESGDLENAAYEIERGRAAASSPDELALFAATGAQLAVELGDHDALAQWTSGEVLQVALRSDDSSAATESTIALLTRGARIATDSDVGRALRRALAQARNAANSPELFAVAARDGGPEDARFAVEALGAVFAPDRPYLRAHRLLARAQLLLRSGERAESVDAAGDAARAFSAMGLRRWTNEAMRLLVSHEPAERRPRTRSSGSALTEREEQVAQLIRRGARNREVAAALQISEHTVERHVSSILGRLGLRSRWQIADPRRTDEA
jgi:DNA-binding CsgD family transcriptional regulator